MNPAKRIADKIALWAHIKRLGRLWGESDEKVAEFAKDAYSSCKEDLEGATKCFKDLADQAEWLVKAVSRSRPAVGGR